MACTSLSHGGRSQEIMKENGGSYAFFSANSISMPPTLAANMLYRKARIAPQMKARIPKMMGNTMMESSPRVVAPEASTLPR